MRQSCVRDVIATAEIQFLQLAQALQMRQPGARDAARFLRKRYNTLGSRQGDAHGDGDAAGVAVPGATARMGLRASGTCPYRLTTIWREMYKSMPAQARRQVGNENEGRAPEREWQRGAQPQGPRRSYCRGKDIR